jgi:hypothetical protein
MQMSADWVMAMLAYEQMIPEYERTYIELNKGKS